MNTSETHLNKYIAFLEKELADCENTKGELGNAKNYIEDFIDERLKIREAISTVMSDNVSLSENVINIIDAYNEQNTTLEEIQDLLMRNSSVYDNELNLIDNIYNITTELDKYKKHYHTSISNRDIIANKLIELGLHDEHEKLDASIFKLAEDVKHGKDCEYNYNKIKDEKSLADYKLRLIHNFLPYCVPEDNTIQKADSFLNTIKGYLNHNAPITSGDLNMEEKVRNFLSYSYENYDSLSNLEVNIENLIIDYKSLQGLTTQMRELLK